MEDLITWVSEIVSAAVAPYMPAVVALGLVFAIVALYMAVSGLRANRRRTRELAQASKVSDDIPR